MNKPNSAETASLLTDAVLSIKRVSDECNRLITSAINDIDLKANPDFPKRSDEHKKLSRKLQNCIMLGCDQFSQHYLQQIEPIDSNLLLLAVQYNNIKQHIIYAMFEVAALFEKSRSQSLLENSSIIDIRYIRRHSTKATYYRTTINKVFNIYKALAFTISSWGENSLAFLSEHVSNVQPKQMSTLLTLDSDASAELDSDHHALTIKVHKRILERHAILSQVELLARSHKAHQEAAEIRPKGILNKERTVIAAQNPDSVAPETKDSVKSVTTVNASFAVLPPGLRAYYLAVTDLFVEKALAYLKLHIKPYIRSYKLSFTLSIAVLIVAVCIAICNAIFKEPYKASGIYDFLTWIIPGFTLYGILILLAAKLLNLGKSFLDQAERINERRHALRQGRLFVHLNGGKMTLEEMDKAFNWNVSPGNAFSNINPDAQAPVGNFLSSVTNKLPDISNALDILLKKITK